MMREFVKHRENQTTNKSEKQKKKKLVRFRFFHSPIEQQSEPEDSDMMSNAFRSVQCVFEMSTTTITTASHEPMI